MTLRVVENGENSSRTSSEVDRNKNVGRNGLQLETVRNVSARATETLGSFMI